jgi:hypothetical protein
MTKICLFLATLLGSGIPGSRLAGQTLLHGDFETRDDAKACARLEWRLSNTRSDVAWTDRPLADVVRDLAKTINATLLFAPSAAARKDETISLEIRGATLATVFKLVAEATKLRFVYERGVIHLATEEDAMRRSMVLRLYAVGELLYQPPDFPASRLDLHPGPVREPEAEQEDAKPRDGSEVVDLVKLATGEEVWSVEGASITVSKSLLVVRHTPAVQAQVRRMLAQAGAAF